MSQQQGILVVSVSPRDQPRLEAETSSGDDSLEGNHSRVLYRSAVMIFMRKENRTCGSAFHVVFYMHLLSPRLLTDSTSLTIRSVGKCFVYAEPVNSFDESKCMWNTTRKADSQAQFPFLRKIISALQYRTRRVVSFQRIVALSVCFQLLRYRTR